ncbi:hypothetical protein LZ32DRAFT_79144 [Colletotrichum eremochloae]|nr:hypothetical protein LZ32DRAFT_79144 [Colletotrichum eremochloae]
MKWPPSIFWIHTHGEASAGKTRGLFPSSRTLPPEPKQVCLHRAPAERERERARRIPPEGSAGCLGVCLHAVTYGEEASKQTRKQSFETAPSIAADLENAAAAISYSRHLRTTARFLSRSAHWPIPPSPARFFLHAFFCTSPPHRSLSLSCSMRGMNQ